VLTAESSSEAVEVCKGFADLVHSGQNLYEPCAVTGAS
jgi:hypothetical protein